MNFSCAPIFESFHTLLTSIFFKCTVNKLKKKLKKKEVIKKND
jgi:hypothetical protein